MKKNQKNSTLLQHLMLIFLEIFILQKKEKEAKASFSSTPDRNRTGTSVKAHRILSPVVFININTI